jgi:ABC-type branched-subunit amino acid transport system ATPase component
MVADSLVSGYGRIRILDSVSVSLSPGEVVAVIGHNGMGKTTLLRTLAGLLKAKSGSIHLVGRDVTHRATAVRSRLGLGYVPQGRQIFPDLTVMENLMIGQAARAGESDIPAMLERFRSLTALLGRPGRALSGGEQQLLALARCLVGRPRVVLLDEPSEGIQPSIVDQIAEHLHDLSTTQRLAILLVEQDLELVSRVAHRVHVMRKGRFVSEIAPRDLGNPAIVKELLWS